MELSLLRFYNTPGVLADSYEIWASLAPFIFIFSSLPRVHLFSFFSSSRAHSSFVRPINQPLHLFRSLRWRVCLAACRRCWTSRGSSCKRWRRGSPPRPTSAPWRPRPSLKWVAPYRFHFQSEWFRILFKREALGLHIIGVTFFEFMSFAWQWIYWSVATTPLTPLLVFIPCRSCCFRSADRFFTTPTTSSSTAASVQTTSRSNRFWRKVKSRCHHPAQQLRSCAHVASLMRSFLDVCRFLLEGN